MEVLFAFVKKVTNLTEKIVSTLMSVPKKLILVLKHKFARIRWDPSSAVVLKVSKKSIKKETVKTSMSVWMKIFVLEIRS